MLEIFRKSPAAGAVMGAAMMALVGKATVTDEEATAANSELTEAGISGAQLIHEAAFNELTEKAGRVEAAELAATTAQAAVQATTEALAAAGAESITALVAQRDAYQVKADQFDKGAGASHTAPRLTPGASDVEKGAPDAHQQAIDELPHNKALSGHPMFG